MVYWLGKKHLGPHRVDFDNLDGDPQKIEVVDTTQDDGRFLGKGLDALTSGRAIKSDFVPTRLQWRGMPKYLPDYHTPYGLLSVSDAFKQIVERVEPGVHQFFPVEYIDKRGQHLQHRWFMNVCNRIDSTDHEATKATGYVLHLGRAWAREQDLPGADREKWRGVKTSVNLVFSPDKIHNVHLWFDKHTKYGPFVSDELAEALEAADLKGVVLAKGEMA